MRFQVWYSSPARSSEFFKFKLYDDDGYLETVKAGLVFTGQRITINMPTIVAFHLRPVKGGLGSSQVEVEYKSALGQLEKANFIGKAVLRQESIAQTRRIFDSLSTWSQSLAGSSKCLNCGSLIPPGNGYCGRCGTPLGPSDKAWRGTDRRRETGFREPPMADPFFDESPSDEERPSLATNRGSYQPSHSGPPKRGKWPLVIVVAVMVLVILGVVVALSIRLGPGGLGPGGFTGFRVSGSGCWSGAFGNFGSSSSIDGCGSREIPMRCDGCLSGVVQKNDDGSWTLTLQVVSNGRLLKSSTTSAQYGLASAADSC